MARDLVRGRDRQTATRASEQRFQSLIRSRRDQPDSGAYPASDVTVRGFTMRRIQYEFSGEVFAASTVGLFALSFVVGIVGGIYGIGGGAIIAPFLVAFFGLPVYTIAGAALMGTFITSVAGVAFYQAIAPLYPDLAVAPDWPLGLLFGAGGALGMYCGARVQKHLPAHLIKWMLVVVILFVAARYLIGIADLM